MHSKTTVTVIGLVILYFPCFACANIIIVKIKTVFKKILFYCTFVYPCVKYSLQNIYLIIHINCVQYESTIELCWCVNTVMESSTYMPRKRTIYTVTRARHVRGTIVRCEYTMICKQVIHPMCINGEIPITSYITQLDKQPNEIINTYCPTK